MVDADRVRVRLDRLGALVAELERTREAGVAGYLADAERQLVTERRVQLAVQIVVDLSAHLAGELELGPAEGYADAVRRLGPEVLDADLAERLATAVGLRNVLVHDYLEIDPGRVFAALDGLDDLRAFARAVHRRLPST